MKRNILITGGAGFIGSHVVRLFVNKYPEYHIINLDKFNFNKVTILENKKVALFESSYQVNGNEITVNNNEFYYNIKYPMEVFESYKEVVNAAADFNKITLVLTKK